MSYVLYNEDTEMYWAHEHPTPYLADAWRFWSGGIKQGDRESFYTGDPRTMLNIKDFPEGWREFLGQDTYAQWKRGVAPWDLPTITPVNVEAMLREKWAAQDPRDTERAKFVNLWVGGEYMSFENPELPEEAERVLRGFGFKYGPTELYRSLLLPEEQARMLEDGTKVKVQMGPQGRELNSWSGDYGTARKFTSVLPGFARVVVQATLGTPEVVASVQDIYDYFKSGDVQIESGSQACHQLEGFLAEREYVVDLPYGEPHAAAVLKNHRDWKEYDKKGSKVADFGGPDPDINLSIMNDKGEFLTWAETWAGRIVEARVFMGYGPEEWTRDPQGITKFLDSPGGKQAQALLPSVASLGNLRVVSYADELQKYKDSHTPDEDLERAKVVREWVRGNFMTKKGSEDRVAVEAFASFGFSYGDTELYRNLAITHKDLAALMEARKGGAKVKVKVNKTTRSVSSWSSSQDAAKNISDLTTSKHTRITVGCQVPGKNILASIEDVYEHYLEHPCPTNPAQAIRPFLNEKEYVVNLKTVSEVNELHVVDWSTPGGTQWKAAAKDPFDLSDGKDWVRFAMRRKSDGLYLATGDEPWVREAFNPRIVDNNLSPKTPMEQRIKDFMTMIWYARTKQSAVEAVAADDAELVPIMSIRKKFLDAHPPTAQAQSDAWAIESWVRGQLMKRPGKEDAGVAQAFKNLGLKYEDKELWRNLVLPEKQVPQLAEAFKSGAKVKVKVNKATRTVSSWTDDRSLARQFDNSFKPGWLRVTVGARVPGPTVLAYVPDVYEYYIKHPQSTDSRAAYGLQSFLDEREYVVELKAVTDVTTLDLINPERKWEWNTVQKEGSHDE